ncbi:MaoC family dehydratase N-terminal domain-containing protein [Candidatus Viridilinea mediisalina]|uniref:Acyl-CoA dehydrogenase n=1 Tax=Candidatus Viridilinea mediisalina TaxID=2024553 RepID=A0A2A6RH13_9CHLR|nr:MaoC family dehydratase N-terminal domain-containing protein [Candidatus Viridilinea mediisalina]PDW02165.1 acyl-CoA dehydrogenase [Candidatus Viridilinea mediisalina]
MEDHPFASWLGRTETVEDELGATQARAAAAMLDLPSNSFEPGTPLPPLWQWFYFLPQAPQAHLSIDGHPQRGGFMPPIELPRRMFAGSRLRFLQPLRIGQPARREGRIRAINQKSGRSGKLVFVTVDYTYLQNEQCCIEEQQEIVYREPGAPVPAPTPSELPAVPEGAWTRMITPETPLLFRFSALTFNAHRIHYDRPYAMEAEGYPGLVVHGPLTAVLLLELVRQHTTRPITSFNFRGQAPLFDLAPFRLVALPGDTEVALEAQAPDGSVALRASAGLG